MNESHMLAKVMWCLLIVAAVTVPVDDVVVRRAVGLTGNPCRPIGQEFHITGQYDLDGRVDATSTLRQFLMRFGRDLCDCLTPCLSFGRLYTSRTCLFA